MCLLQDLTKSYPTTNLVLDLPTKLVNLKCHLKYSKQYFHCKTARTPLRVPLTTPDNSDLSITCLTNGRNFGILIVPFKTPLSLPPSPSLPIQTFITHPIKLLQSGGGQSTIYPSDRSSLQEGHSDLA